MQRSLILNQLNPVPERIKDMTPAHAGNAVVFGDLYSGRQQTSRKAIVIDASQRRMRLPCRAKVSFDSQMNLHRPALKPAATTLGKLGGLWNLGHPKQPAVK